VRQQGVDPQGRLRLLHRLRVYRRLRLTQPRRTARPRHKQRLFDPAAWRAVAAGESFRHRSSLGQHFGAGSEWLAVRSASYFPGSVAFEEDGSPAFRPLPLQQEHSRRALEKADPKKISYGCTRPILLKNSKLHSRRILASVHCSRQFTR
jgi:hypothetical protein